MKTLYNGRRDPLVRRKIWQRRVLGIEFKFHLTLPLSKWRVLAWPFPIRDV